MNPYALRFDAVDDYVEIADNALLSGGAGKSITVEAWVKPDVVSAEHPVVMKFLDNKSKDWGFKIATGAIEVDIENNGDNWSLRAGSISAGTWTHVAFTFANSLNVVEIFLNGISAGQQSLTKDMPDTKAPIRIGRHGYLTQYFDGDIDELRIWNYARSAAQISADMNQTVSPSEPGLIGYWRLDEGSGQTAADLTSNGNAGRLGSSRGSDAQDPQWVISDVPLNAGLGASVAASSQGSGERDTQLAALSVPVSYALHQNYPNPFNLETRIAYDLPEAGYVQLVVYDILGRELRVLVAGEQPAGRHAVSWEGRDSSGQRVTSGICFYRLQVGAYTAMKKMLVVQ